MEYREHLVPLDSQLCMQPMSYLPTPPLSWCSSESCTLCTWWTELGWYFDHGWIGPDSLSLMLSYIGNSSIQKLKHNIIWS